MPALYYLAWATLNIKLSFFFYYRILVLQFMIFYHSIYLQVTEKNGEEEHQETVEIDAEDTTDGSVLVNGNEGGEQWGTNNEGNPSA